MKTTASEIRNRSFGKSFRGLDAGQVGEFLDRIASEWETAAAEHSALEHKVTEMESQIRDFHSLEKGFQQTIMQAQEASGKAVDSAKREGQLIIREAELKAAMIVEKARNDLTMLREQVTILRAKRDSITSRLKMLLNSELELIRALEVEDENQQAPPVEERRELSTEKLEIEEIIRSLDK
jgi:cell division initiation protein